MTAGPNAERLAALREVVEAAQHVAGALAARHRGDHADAAHLLGGFEDDRRLAGGAMLVAELSLGLAARSSEQPFEETVRELCLRMEASLEAAGRG